MILVVDDSRQFCGQLGDFVSLHVPDHLPCSPFPLVSTSSATSATSGRPR